MQLITTQVTAPLAASVGEILGLPPPIALNTEVFSNGQLKVCGPPDILFESKVALFQSFPDRVHDRLFELLLALDLLRARGAQQITAVLPYLPYSRSDRPAMQEGPVPVRLVASLLEQAGLARLVTLELHAPQLCGIFRGPVTNIEFAPPLARYLTPLPRDVVVVSPDFGGAKRAEQLAATLNCPVGIMRKHRHNKTTHSEDVLGDVSGRAVILIDDEINSGRTVFSAAARLKACGATGICLAVAHSLFTPEAAATWQNSSIDRIIVADSIGRREYLPAGVETVSISEEIASVMRLG